MKVLVFTDVHGSLNSLKALINCEDFKTADKIIFLGDVVVGCSRANECIELLKTIDCVSLIGNNDAYITYGIPKVERDGFNNEKLDMLEWMNNHISKENKDLISSWPKDYFMNINDKIFYFTHYAWENHNNQINVFPAPKTKDISSRKEMFKNINADYFVFGHEHQTNHIIANNKHYFCLGTIGLKSPGSYLVINVNNDKIELEEKFINFDINEEIDLMDEAGYPYEKDKIKKN